jgi:hypothetical protein
MYNEHACSSARRTDVKCSDFQNAIRRVNQPVPNVDNQQMWMKPNKHGTAFLNKRAESKCRLISMGRVYGW